MKRARPPVTVDLFGFDPIGSAVYLSEREAALLLGHGALPLAVYAVLKRFATPHGKVLVGSYWRLLEVLRIRREGAGRRAYEPTREELRRAVATLARAGLVVVPTVDNEARGVLQIFLAHGVGESLTPAIRPGYRPGSTRPRTRADA